MEITQEELTEWLDARLNEKLNDLGIHEDVLDVETVRAIAGEMAFDLLFQYAVYRKGA